MSFKINGIDVIDNSRNVVGTSVTSSSRCDIPVGVSTSRTSNPYTGSIRYNTEIPCVEYYNGTTWICLNSQKIEPLARGVFGGGNNQTPGLGSPLSVVLTTMEYVQIATLSNTTSFGSLTQARNVLSSCSSSTRGLFGGGSSTPSPTTDVNTIDYITIATTGNATDFGDLTVARNSLTACSNSTRGVFAGGLQSPGAVTNTIDYITIATTGNATDFGDLSETKYSLAACSSPTRGFFAGGVNPGIPNGVVNTIDYITIATTGNTASFGNLTTASQSLSACSSPTRGVFAGGSTSLTTVPTDRIEYISFDSFGNTTFFGNLTTAIQFLSACSNSTRGLFAGGDDSTPGVASENAITYVAIPTIGNSTSFGTLSANRDRLSACSDSHGGV